MHSRAKYLAAAIVFAVVGSVYEFTPPKIIISWGLGFLRHNDRVLFGAICLILAAVFLFKALKRK